MTEHAEPIKQYIVYRKQLGTEQYLKATGNDIAAFMDKTEAIDYCRGLRELQTKLTLLGVQFAGSYEFNVKVMTHTRNGVKFGDVVLTDDETLEAEYESDQLELENKVADHLNKVRELLA